MLLLTVTAIPAHAQSITGTWIGEFQDHRWGGGVSETLWMTLRANTREERHGFSFTLKLKELDGLGISKGHNGKSRVTFDMNREAGNFGFEGQFVDDAGSGTFTFSTSAAYVSKMGRLGYRSLDDSKLLMLAIHDVTTSFVEELGELGFMAPGSRFRVQGSRLRKNQP